LCTVLPCTKANDIPGLNSVQLVPSHRRELQTAVSTSVGLLSALANTGVGRIVLAPGTYVLNAELSITRSVVLEAAVAGSVVLDAQASSSSRRRVLYINPGSLGVVQLIGLNITGGNVQNLGNGYSSYGGGAYVGGGTVTFSSCTITGNIASVGGGVAVVGGTVAISLCTISGITASYGDVTAGLGGGVYVEGGTVAISSCTINGNTAGYGGGVYVGFGTVTITSSSITGNTAYGYVRAHVQEFPLSPCHQRQRHRHPASTSSKEVKTSHGPNGKMADVLASTLACTTAADASVNYSMYVLQRP
jgi:hypothetical protein